MGAPVGPGHTGPVTDEELEGFDRYVFPQEAGRTVYWRGPERAPAVILLHELPGMVPECVELARQLSSGYQVHLPLLFGAPGQTGNALDMARWTWCIRHEFSLLSRGTTSPITAWVADLVHEVAERTQVPRVAVIGMCLTGSLVFGLVAEPQVAAVVASQPSLPFGLTPAHQRDLSVPSEQFRRDAATGAPVLAMRYRGDPVCPRARLVQLARAYGEELPPGPQDQTLDVTLGKLRIVEVPGRKHALLTAHRHEDAVAALREFLEAHLTAG